MKNKQEGIVIADPGIISKFSVRYVDNKTQFLNKKITFERDQPLELRIEVLGVVYVGFMNCYVFADATSTGLFAIFENWKIKKIADGFLFN